MPRINLPYDILVEILYRLAVKDLLRLRCGSKDCRDLIDSPDFVKLHLSHSLKTDSHRFLIMVRNGKSKPKPFSLELDSLEIPQIKSSDILTDLQVKFPIIGSCNGLIALKTNNGDATVICNPTTRKIRLVPKPPKNKKTESSFPVSTGFGYDPISDDYKLVMLIQRYNKHDEVSISTKIYSLKSRNWRNSFHEIPCVPNLVSNAFERIHLVNNALHWVMVLDSDDRSKTIVAFDLTTERYRYVPLPLLDHNTSLVELYYAMDLKELGGCLCMIGHRYDYSKRCLFYDMWVMKEYGLQESWTQLFPFTMSGEVYPVAYSKCGQKFLCISYDYNGYKGKLVWYNLKGEKTEDIEIEVRYYPTGPDVCISSLVSPMAAGKESKRIGNTPA
ncbi:hypothetical protein COLO4_35009 [Corchorus olitorius]|uniref:F-box domain-containing protein n=1 Tax=Corchorus olitorius TaxID=93759 RepID=A0A1R3GIL4_9ROSI|nr:hypothetical protein COLO4_35009 [Corchorus olitorius]